VGQPITIHPLDNDLPGADPVNPDAKLALAGDVASPPNATVTTDLASGTVVVTATRPGPYLLTYTLAYGNAPFATGAIRVDVIPVPASPAPPVVMPTSVVLHGTVAASVDVLANAFDPAGAVLVVLHAAPVDPNSHLSVAVVDGHYLRIAATDALGSSGAQVVRFTVTDGLTGPVTGEVSVTHVADQPDSRPVPKDDYATVRAGDTVTVAVLDNDTNPAGAPMSLVADVAAADPTKTLPPGQLVVTAPAGASVAGTAYVTGNLVRFVAQTGVTKPSTMDVAYVVANAAGDRAVGHLHVLVTPLPGPTNPNHPPAPLPVEARAVSGQTITVPIPVSGVDVDGDSVRLIGIGSAPRLGRILAMNDTSLRYQAFPTSAGTDSFTYRVADRYGAVGEATVRVAVTPPGTPQPPVAVDITVTAAPQATLQIDVLSSVIRERDDVVTLERLAPYNPGLPASVSLTGPTGPINVVAPSGLTPVVVQFAVTDGIGIPSVATLTVRAEKGFDNPPVCYDTYPTATHESTISVDVLASCVDPDGAHDDIAVTKVFDPQAQVVDGRVVLTTAPGPRTVAFEVKDKQGATATGLIHLELTGVGAPYAKPGANLQIGQDGSLAVAVSDDVVDPNGRAIRLTTKDKIWASPPNGLTATSTDEHGLALKATNGYIGPAAVTFEVTDGASLTDPAGQTAVITIPVQVGPVTPVLHCPVEPIDVVEGGDALNLDVSTVCHVWTQDPGTVIHLNYSADWTGGHAGLDLSGSGTHVLTVSAASQATPDTIATLRIAVADTAATPVELSVRVAKAPLATVHEVVLDGVYAGTTRTVDLAGSVRSSLRDPAVAVLAIAQSSGMPASATFTGSTVTITPGTASHGTITFVVTVTDVADHSRTDRLTTGQITLHVLNKPDRPAPPDIGRTVLSHSVQLSWPAPANNGAPILRYTIGYTGGGSQDCPGSPCLITGLVNATIYTFTVVAVNEVGPSDPSPPSQPAQPNDVPMAVTALALSNPQDHTVTLTWVAAQVDGTPVTGYDIAWGGGGSMHVNAAGQNMTATPSGLDNDVIYTFTISAVNKQGHGPTSQVTGESAGAPAEPPGPSFTAIESTDASTRAVTVSWPAVDPNGPGPTTYTVSRTGGSGPKTVCANVTATSCPDDGIANDGTLYHYTVVAENADAALGPNHTSPASPATTMDASFTPDQITNVSASPTGNNGEATVRFDAPASHGASSTITCTANGNGCGTWTFPVGGQTGVVRTITGLANGQSTTVRLQDCNGSTGGTGAGSPCDTTAATSVTTYGPIQGLNISTSANGPSVDFTVTVDPNGKPATVHIQTSTQTQNFTSGVGSWSWSSSDNVGYSNSDTITVTVSDPGRNTLNAQRSQSTPPPPPTVTVSRGAPCGGGGGSACQGVGGPCSSSSCGYIHVQTANFGGNVSCSFSSDAGAFPSPASETYGANQSKDSYYWYGYSRTNVYVTCAGVQGSFTWP
jgi:hypothetical protein